MMKKIGLFMIMFLLIGYVPLQAQGGLKALRISVLTEASTLPSYKVVRIPVHPGVSFGLDFWEKNGEHWSRSLTAELGYYYQEMSEHAIMLGGIYGLSYETSFGLKPKFFAGLGYKHSILPGHVYTLEDAEYVSTHHKGQPQVTLKLGLGLEYRLSEKFALTTEYAVMAASPYSLLPASVHNIFSIGTKINLNTDK
jgi:hypothetical protein